MPFAILRRLVPIVVLLLATSLGARSGTKSLPLAFAQSSAGGLTAKPSLVGAISLSWEPVQGAPGYVLEVSNSGQEGTFMPLAEVGAGTTAYRHTGLYYSQKVYYRIKATGTQNYSPVVSATTHPKGQTFNIMPLGDSNTEGGSSQVAQEQKASYRARLSELLNASASKGKYDFVGSERSGGNLLVDTDHAGFGGARNSNLEDLLKNGFYTTWDGTKRGLQNGGDYLKTFAPDIILLHSGTNNISQNGADNSQATADELERVLNQIDAYEQASGREVTVVLATLIKTVCNNSFCYQGNGRSMNEVIDLYNDKLRAMVQRRAAAGDALLLVDMGDAGIKYDFADNGGDMADPLHPMQRGYDKMAPVWFGALDNLLNVQPQSPPDTKAPETSISAKPAALSNKSSANFTFASDEQNVQYLVSLNGAAFKEVQNPYTVANLPDGQHTLSVKARDASGNIDATPATYTWVVDTKAPEVPSIAAPVAESYLSNGKPVANGIAEAGATVSLQLNSKPWATVRAGENGAWSYTSAAALADGTYLLKAQASDEAGNSSAYTTDRRFTIDTTAPQLQITTDAPAHTNAPFSLTFSFTEAVIGFDVADVEVQHAAVSGFKQLSDKEYAAMVEPKKDGEVTISVAAGKARDAAGNTNQAASLTRTYDSTAPTATLATTAPVLVNASFTVSLSVSEKVVGFNLNDLVLENATASELKQQGQQYTFTLKPLQNGDMQVSIAAGAFTDLAGNPNAESNSISRRYDAEPPTVSLSTQAPELTNKPFAVQINFSEDVSGLELNDLNLKNATASGLEQQNPKLYVVQVQPNKDGTVEVNLPANRVQDAATNGNTASNVLSVRYDATAPEGYTLAFAAEQVDVRNQQAVQLTVQGAEAGATYTYSISNGKQSINGSATASAAALSIGPLDVSGLPDGTLTATLYFTDAAGNTGETVEATVEKQTRNITAVEAQEKITVPFRTTFAQLGLPKKVNVTYANGETDKLEVEWQEGNYSGLQAGQYTLQGQLQLKENTTNLDNLTATVTVQVEPNKAPTALQFSADSFRPDIKPTEVIGVFSTTDPDDTDFTYTLVSGDGSDDNALFELENGNELHLPDNKGLSGKSVFKIRVRSTDPFENSIERSFTLTKTLYKPNQKLKLVNAFSPDGDLINDTWLVPELRYYNDVEVEVFDRSGRRLFRTQDAEEGWDGRNQEGRIVQGAYFYVIRINDIGLVQKGVVTVLN